MKSLVLLFGLLLATTSFAEVLEEVYLSPKDSLTFFNKLKSLSTQVAPNRYRLDFIAQNGAFRFICDATATTAACSALFTRALSDPASTQIATGKTPNILYARFRNPIDNQKLSVVKSGVRTSEKRILLFKPEPYRFPRFAINCQQGPQLVCFAMSVVDCATVECGFTR